MKQTVTHSLLILLVVLLPSVTYSQPYSPTGKLHSTKYDKQFKASFARWMPGQDYRWLKAQCYQESRFNPFAVSPAGARGLCQFMPRTADEVAKSLGTTSNPFNPKWSIEAAAYYDRKMFNFWKSPRPPPDRIKLMLASYNAGAGNLFKAQKACVMAALYQDIIRCLPAITGHHSKETINYVRFIEKFRRELLR